MYPLSYIFTQSLASSSLPHKRNTYVCTKEYTLVHGFSESKKQAYCMLPHSAYTNPANACGQRCLVRRCPPFWTMKGLLSEVIALTRLAHGLLPPRMVSEVLGLGDLKFFMHTYTEILLRSRQQVKPLSSCHTHMLSKQLVREPQDKCCRPAEWTAKHTNPQVWKCNIMDFKIALGENTAV